MGNNKSNAKRGSTLKHAFLVALGTFFFAIIITANSQALISNVKSMTISFLLLLFIILVGIVFDIVGIAATAAQEAPFHARASRRLLGAKKSIWMVRNADKVASFCNDVVGDICGTVSGAVGASIVFSLAKYFDQSYFWIVSTTMIGLVAAITVGGKAAGKSTAINKADRIILWAGYLLEWVGQVFRKKQCTAKKNRKGK